MTGQLVYSKNYHCSGKLHPDFIAGKDEPCAECDRNCYESNALHEQSMMEESWLVKYGFTVFVLDHEAKKW